MKRRLRKKLRLGEFVELGFEVDFQLLWAANDPRLDTFWDQFIEHIESRGLYCAGACGQAWDMVVYKGHKRAATEEDRADIERWLSTHGEVADVRIGPLFNTWRAAEQALHPTHGARSRVPRVPALR